LPLGETAYARNGSALALQTTSTSKRGGVRRAGAPRARAPDQMSIPVRRSPLSSWLRWRAYNFGANW